MELRYYRYFVAVAEELHFGKAAERLHIAQPPLSMQIKALEKYLGGQLLERNKRSVQLTEAGKVFLEEARLTLKQADSALEKTRLVLQGKAGHLEIGYTGSAVFSGIFGEKVRTFKQYYPQIHLNAVEMPPHEQLQALQKREIQLGFLTVLSLAVPSHITTLTLASWRMVLAVERNHPLATKLSVRLADLSQEAFITYKQPYLIDNVPFIRYLCGFEPHTVHYADNAMLMLALVSAGMGVALIPQALATTQMADNIAYLPVTDITDTMDCLLAFNRNGQDPAVKSFIDSIQTV